MSRLMPRGIRGPCGWCRRDFERNNHLRRGLRGRAAWWSSPHSSPGACWASRVRGLGACVSERLLLFCCVGVWLARLPGSRRTMQGQGEPKRRCALGACRE